jgi:hypothetical protein
LAKGEIFIRPEGETTTAAGTAAVCVTVLASGEVDAGAGELELTASTFSPGSPTTAIRPFTGTFEPSGAAINKIVPLS